MNIKPLLSMLHKRQVHLIAELHNQGFKTTKSDLSRYISGGIKSVKAKQVLKECGEIIEVWIKQQTELGVLSKSDLNAIRNLM